MSRRNKKILTGIERYEQSLLEENNKFRWIQVVYIEDCDDMEVEFIKLLKSGMENIIYSPDLDAIGLFDLNFYNKNYKQKVKQYISLLENINYIEDADEDILQFVQSKLQYIHNIQSEIHGNTIELV